VLEPLETGGVNLNWKPSVAVKEQVSIIGLYEERSEPPGGSRMLAPKITFKPSIVEFLSSPIDFNAVRFLFGLNSLV